MGINNIFKKNSFILYVMLIALFFVHVLHIDEGH